MLESAKVGMDLINDIRALSELNALQTAARLDLPVCIMHMQGEPRTMQMAPHYISEGSIRFFAKTYRTLLTSRNSQRKYHLGYRGLGFGKSVQHNYKLLQQTTLFAKHYPVLIGLSRKSNDWNCPR